MCCFETVSEEARVVFDPIVLAQLFVLKAKGCIGWGHQQMSSVILTMSIALGLEPPAIPMVFLNRKGEKYDIVVACATVLNP